MSHTQSDTPSAVWKLAEKYFPSVMLGYTHYTAYICKRCGKVEIFVTNQETDIPPDLRPKS